MAELAHDDLEPPVRTLDQRLMVQPGAGVGHEGCFLARSPPLLPKEPAIPKSFGRGGLPTAIHPFERPCNGPFREGSKVG